MKVSTPEIAWHGKEPIFSIDFSQASNSLWRLASAGGDADIKIWKVDQDEDGNITTEFLSNLSRHTKTVNVVRFSTTDFLASGSDDGTIIIWKLAENYGSDKCYLESEDLEVRESWTVSKILRGHLEDVYDIAWSRDATRLISGSVDNSAIVWDVDKCQKLNILKEHTHYVQGVSWDPLNQYFMTLSSDRSCRVYSMEKQRSLYNISKLPSSRPLKDGETKRKYYRIFHEETLQTFFRRPNFSPDGKLMVVPAGQIEDKDDMKNTTFIFTRNSMSKPVVCLLSGQKASIAVRCCPVLFEKRDMKEASSGNTFNLPYRMIIAVATLDSVILYDTQQKLPFAYISCIHYAALTDIAWSHDAKFLVVSSADGYCSLIAFADDELGVKRQLELCDNPQVCIYIESLLS
ncbi:uncharacterized protein TRIADDRAFT_26010 [Trichoplax adhaerens]|uniref:CAF1B/HIR1 beta-propeller domain-containing protein n=1 Tax=Trichoplax adhaerens TaxID=10228 RepID=B3RWT4_TRIAD|nr:hypothetical protein TRIADDRAFT_26010 [Trichoplax adhaerens]EDV25181.1 hypothetical protein TRIADDRAFT_26010 [Trichoplax adhaerens]|eukprot:XP_002113071.1 hypothetical protein TRIADDRAFT_26010 [Trichoplax adhaerens]